MKNVTGLSDDYEGDLDLPEPTFVQLDLVQQIADKVTRLFCGVSILSNLAVLVTLSKLRNVKNYCPVRLLQILAIYQTLWGTLHGVEDPRVRPLESMVPQFIPRNITCQVSFLKYFLRSF